MTETEEIDAHCRRYDLWREMKKRGQPWWEPFGRLVGRQCMTSGSDVFRARRQWPLLIAETIRGEVIGCDERGPA